jgi:plastocyanin
MICIRLPVRQLAAIFGGLSVAAISHAPLYAADATTLVTIANFTFEPQTLIVKAGTTVTFENDDDIPHQVVATGGAFRSKALDTGDTYAFTFTEPGEIAYFCSLHPHMQGTITVTP